MALSRGGEGAIEMPSLDRLSLTCPTGITVENAPGDRVPQLARAPNAVPLPCGRNSGIAAAAGHALVAQTLVLREGVRP